MQLNVRYGPITNIQQRAERPFFASCIGGHGPSPYEQKTQQSPAFGLSRTPQLAQL